MQRDPLAELAPAFFARFAARDPGVHGLIAAIQGHPALPGPMVAVDSHEALHLALQSLRDRVEPDRMLACELAWELQAKGRPRMACRSAFRT